MGWNFRLAEAKDAEDFSRWAATNSQIDPKDLESCLSTKNPTVLFFVAENPEGQVVAFAPLYLQMSLGYLGFNPAADGRDRLQAMQTLMDGVSAFCVQFGIREIVTLSKEDYPVAKWAMKHDFDLEPRQLLKLDLNKILELAEAH